MKRKYAPIGFIYLFGLICASFLSAAWCFIAAGALLTALLLMLVFMRAFKKRKSLLFPQALSLCAAFLIFGLYSAFFIEPQLSLCGSERVIRGTVTGVDIPDNDTVRLTVSGDAEGIPIKLALYVPDTGIRAGDRVIFGAAIYKLRDSADFSQRQYYFSKGIFVGARAVSSISVESRGFPLFKLPTDISGYFREQIRGILNGEEGGLLRAMFFGDKSGLSPYLSELIRRAGLSHLIAVSGMHISLIVNIAAVFIGLLPNRRPRLRYFMTAALIVLLMLFFGMSASVTRSGVMLLIYYAAEPLRRKSSAVHTLGFAAMAITLLRPYACRDIGLWMSILGTAGVALVAPAVLSRVKFKRFKRAGGSVVSSVCASVCVLPISAFCFGGASIVSAVSVLAIYPLFFASVVLVLISVITGGAFMELLMLPGGILARGMIYIIKFFGSLPFAYVSFEGRAYPLIIGLTAAGIVLIALIPKRKDYLPKFLAIALCMLVTVPAAERLFGRDDITVTVYSDGKDALALVKSKSGVSAFAYSDSAKISRRIFAETLGRSALLICASKSAKNNMDAFYACKPLEIVFPGDSKLCDVCGEYTAEVREDVITFNIRGKTFSLLKAGGETDADIAVFSGYKKSPGYSGAGTEIFCDKRCTGGLNAYYEKLEIIIDAGGEALLRREGGAEA